MLLLLLVSALATVCVGRPYEDNGDFINPYNVVTVPPNCPAGQQWINGECRDVWRQSLDEIIALLIKAHKLNVVTVPQNCNAGQQWINGQCRDVWRSPVNPKNIITVPPNCPPGQEYINGACRDVWNKAILRSEVVAAIVNEFVKKDAMRNIISVPNQCPSGTKPDALGICRPIFE